MFGALFFIGQELLGYLADGTAVDAVSAGYRLQGGRSVLDLQVYFRGRAAEDPAPELDVKHVGGRVYVAEKPVQVDGIYGAGDLVLVGKDRLDAFAAYD